MPDPRDELRAFIAGVRRRWSICARLGAIGGTTMAAAVPLGIAVLVARLANLQGQALIVTALTGLVAALVAAMYAARRATPPVPDSRRIARFVEEWAASAPGVTPFEDTLTTAVAVSSTRDQDGGSFGALLIGAALERLHGIAPASVIPSTVMRRAALQAVAGGVALVLAIGAGRAPLLAAADAARLAWYPERIRIEVLPGDVRVPAGQPLRVRAVLRAGDRIVTHLVPSLVISTTADRAAEPMAQQGKGFELLLPPVDRTFRYQVAAAGGLSREFTVAALFPPKVQRIEARYEFPAFTGLAPRDSGDGDLYAPQGSRVRLRVHTDKPVASGVLALTNGARTLTLRNAGAAVLEADLVLTKDDSYRLRFDDHEGQHGGGDTEYFIRLMDDRPPDVRILRPSGDQQITPLEEVAIEARADDDYGIAAFDLIYSVAGRPERTLPFERVSGTNVARVGAHLLAAEELKVQPGDVITYYARARDVARGKRPAEAKSDIFFLEVRPFTEEFVSAQSQASAAAGDPQLDALIAVQKEIISATWNVERRSAAGRSAADIKAIAKAQEALKARAQQMGADDAAGMPFQMPQQMGPFGQRRSRPAGADAVAAAVASMGLAAQQLEGEKTREAMPHEMRALQGLLQAQAEVRRRQVSQQANGASGSGSGRQGQDMSALFDKELQRQQRTNYETRSRAEERARPAADDSANDRMRDLARRQEEIARRERELAQAAVPAEEQKRQLETLTREQQQLQREAEALTRQLERATSGKGSPSPRGGSGGDLRKATEQMRQASNDLGRGDPAAAAARAEQAARQMRAQADGARAGAPGAAGAAAGQEQQLAEARSLSRQLDESRALREKLDTLAGRIRQGEAQAQGRGGPRGAAPGPSGAPDAGRAGRQGQPAGAGSSGPSLEQLRQEYGRELGRARDALAGAGQGPARGSLSGSTPEEQVLSQSSPGNEAFKQDFSSWESLRKDVDLALEQRDAALSARLASNLAAYRLSAGASERVPDAYAKLIARYYASLARATK